MPTKAEKPAPKRLSARPVAYWLVLSQITSQPKASAIAMPAPMPAAKASTSEPECTAVAKPDRGHQHDAFGTEVDDAGALVDQQAEAGDREHGSGVQRRTQQQGNFVHATTLARKRTR